MILVDLDLPDGDGLQLADAIRTLPGLARTPFVFCSPLDEPHVARLRQCAIAEIDHVAVPIVPALVRAKIAMLVRMVRQEREQRDLQQGRTAQREFVSHLTHELRSPLNAVIGFAQLVVDERVGPLQPKQKDYLSDVLGIARQLLQVIDAASAAAKRATS